MPQSQAELVKALVDAGVHFGHRVSRWNPKMEPYIHGKRNMIHIIDVRETAKGLTRDGLPAWENVPSRVFVS